MIKTFKVPLSYSSMTSSSVSNKPVYLLKVPKRCLWSFPLLLQLSCACSKSNLAHIYKNQSSWWCKNIKYIVFVLFSMSTWCFKSYHSFLFLSNNLTAAAPDRNQHPWLPSAAALHPVSAFLQTSLSLVTLNRSLSSCCRWEVMERFLLLCWQPARGARHSLNW